MEKYISIPTGPIFTGGPCRGIVHVVEKGDTLYLLGKHYHVAVSKIMFANPYVNVYNLQIGDELCIPVSAAGEGEKPGYWHKPGQECRGHHGGGKPAPLPQPWPEQPSGGRPLPQPWPEMPNGGMRPVPLPQPWPQQPNGGRPSPMPMPNPTPTPMPMPVAPPVPAPSPMPVAPPVPALPPGSMPTPVMPKGTAPTPMPVAPPRSMPITPKAAIPVPQSMPQAPNGGMKLTPMPSPQAMPMPGPSNGGMKPTPMPSPQPMPGMCCDMERPLADEADPPMGYRIARPRFREREWNRYRNDRTDYRPHKNDGEYEIVPILSEDYD